MKTATRLKKPFVVGRQAALTMSAVEGMHMSPKTQEMFGQFAKDGLSPEQQRQHLETRHLEATVNAKAS